MKRLALIVMITAFLAACSSGVKLDPAAVEDRNTSALATSGDGYGTSGATSETAIKGVDLNASSKDMAGPAGVERMVFFDYNSYTIKPEYQAVIEAHARFLKASANRKVSLEGNTDVRGGSEYNLALGQKRAEAVRRALILLGVSDAQLEAISFGKEKPLSLGTDEASHAKNRRTEFSYR
jgi:peptidoglycan-associated lipoprotein